MPRKIYFKVLSKDRTSARVTDVACLHYPVKKRVEKAPHTVGCCVFNTELNAIMFSTSDEIIVKCIGHGRPKKPKLLIRFTGALYDLIVCNSKPYFSDLMDAPTGTVCFDAITTLE